jgi:hypothetical protein
VYSIGVLPGQDAPYTAHALWGYDPKHDEIICFELNSVPEILVHRGRFNADDSLDLIRKDESGTVLQKSRIYWSGADELVFEAEFTAGRPEKMRFARDATA